MNYQKMRNELLKPLLKVVVAVSGGMAFILPFQMVKNRV